MKRIVFIALLPTFFILYFPSQVALGEEGSLVEVRVKGLALDPTTKQPIVVLEDLDDEMFLPIWVDEAVAMAIALGLDGTPTPRPLTHDLLKNMLDGLDAEVGRVVINDLRGGIFYAVIFLERNGVQISIDSRPSDAIAIALRTKALIFVSEEVMQEAGRKVESGEEEKPEEEVIIEEDQV